jgi:hypothetical protein
MHSIAHFLLMFTSRIPAYQEACEIATRQGVILSKVITLWTIMW